MSELIYHLLYRLLFVVHAVFAAYVAGGTLWLSLFGARQLFRTRAGNLEEDAIAKTLRDWLPFVLGLAITFGIGPLLFIQLIDGPAFYTANLLLSHRFMALIPVLIAGFYLLYVQKAHWPWVRSRIARFAVPTLAFACFGFTAWSWSENHLLAQSRTLWPEVYARGPSFFGHGELPFRMMIFAGLALQCTAALAAAQNLSLLAKNATVRRLRITAILGVALVLGGMAFYPAVEDVALLGVTGGAILFAEIIVITGWLRIRERSRGKLLAMIFVGITVLAERLAALRETIRVARGGADHLTDTASAQGFGVFLASLLLAAGAIVWSVWRVRRDITAANSG